MSILSTVFLALLALHAAYAVHRNRQILQTDPTHPELRTVCFSAPPFIVTCLSALKPRTPRDLVSGYLQFGLFIFACVLGTEQAIFTRRLISPVDIGLGLLVGHLVFGMSLLITQTSVREAFLHLIDFDPIWTFVVENPAVLLQYAVVSVAEEMIYRVGAQPALIAAFGTPWLAILVVAIVFCVVHEHFFKNPWEQSSEFFAFSMLLGALYYWTGSLILVIVVHAVRNIEIAFLEELVQVQACGSDELAGIERQYARGARAAVLLAGPGVRGEVVCLEYVRPPIAPAHAMESL